MLNAIDSIVPRRYWAWTLCGILCVACILLSALSPWWTWPALAFGALTFVGYVDYSQDRQAIRRNYPVVAHFRFFFDASAFVCSNNYFTKEALVNTA